MKYIRSFYFYTLTVVTFFLGTALTIVLSWFSKDKTRTYQTAARNWARMLAWASFIPVRIEGLENVPRHESVVFISNHQGAADILALLAYLPCFFRFVIKQELFAVPFFGWYLKKAGFLAIERGESGDARKMLKEAVRLLKSGENILIFPEGTRSTTGKLQEFKRGSLLLASLAKVRVVPIGISGSFNILPAKSYIYNVVPVKMRIGQPVGPDKFDSLREIVQGLL
jgi:1-acyl-sn-glycerol-3-phosphate acyltransferase